MAMSRSQNILMIEAATQIPVLLGMPPSDRWLAARAGFCLSAGVPYFFRAASGLDYGRIYSPAEGVGIRLVTNFLYALGYPIAQNGVMIMIGSYELMVKDACSGMNSIFALSAIGIFYVHEFVQHSWVEVSS